MSRSKGPGGSWSRAAPRCVASISWLVFEKPLNRLKRHFPYVAPAVHPSAQPAGWRAARPRGVCPTRPSSLPRNGERRRMTGCRSVVSVLLPVYNAGPYLAAALGRILRQDYDRLEVIAIDDGSTDNSLEILERYRQADNRISIISRENRGLVATLNEGLAAGPGRAGRQDGRRRHRLSLAPVAPGGAVRPAAGPRFCGAGIDTLLGGRIVKGRPDPVFQVRACRYCRCSSRSSCTRRSSTTGRS